MILTTLALTAALLAGPTTGPDATCTTDADCAALGYTGQLGYGVTADKIRLYSDRYLVAEDTSDDQSHPDPVAECLLSQGYRGLPGDGAEAIYAPASVIEGCAR